MQVERPHRAASDLLLLSGPLGRRTGWSTRRGRAFRTDERGMRSVDGVQSRSRQIDALREIWRSAYVQKKSRRDGFASDVGDGTL